MPPLALLMLSLFGAAPGVLYVDPAAPGGGDGTPARPFSSIAAALGQAGRRAPVLKLAPGVYPGALTLPPGTVLEGVPGAVLEAGRGAVVTARGALHLKRLTVRGGEDGVRGAAVLRLDEVTFEGQRQRAVVTAGWVQARRCRFEAGEGAFAAIALTGPGAALELEDSQVHGAYARALWSEGGRMRVLRGSVAGAATALHHEGGAIEVEGLAIAGGRGPAVFVGGATGALRSLRIAGGEYGLLARNSRLEVEDAVVVQARRAAFGLTGGSTRLRRVRTMLSGAMGALQVGGGEVEVDGFWAHAAADQAIYARQSTVALRSVLVTSVRASSEDAGDAIQLQESRARLSQVAVRDTHGACLSVTQSSQVEAISLRFAACRFGGVVVQTQSQLTLTSAHLGPAVSPGVAVLSQSSVGLVQIGIGRTTEPPVIADCEQGARVRAWQVRAGGVPIASSACISAR